MTFSFFLSIIFFFTDASGLQLSLSLALLSYPWFVHPVIELFTVILRLFYCVSSLYNRGTGRGTGCFHIVCFLF